MLKRRKGRKIRYEADYQIIEEMTSGLKMMCLTRTYTRIRIQRSGAGVGNNGVRHKASIRQQSTRDFFVQVLLLFLLETKEQVLKAHPK